MSQRLIQRVEEVLSDLRPSDEQEAHEMAQQIFQEGDVDALESIGRQVHHVALEIRAAQIFLDQN